MFGLSKKHLDEIINIISLHNEVEEASIFGSRALGTNKNASDVDIAVKGKNLKHLTISSLNGKLNFETYLPYYFDIINYNKIKNNQLIKHIDKFSIRIYYKQK